MNILERINFFEEGMGLCESGIRNMTKFAKNFKEAEIIFHMDL
jgi:hypothetical protein